MFKFNLCLSTRRRLLVFFAMPLAIYSQSTESDTQTELIRALRERIDQLEKRMAQMESALAAGTSPVRVKPETKPEAAGVSTTRLPVARSRSTGCVAFRQIFQTPPEYPVNAFQASEVKSLQRPPRDRRCSANRCSAPPR